MILFASDVLHVNYDVCLLMLLVRLGVWTCNDSLFVFRFPAGYCFVDFYDSDAALRAQLRLNGKIIPNTEPVCKTLYSHLRFINRSHLYINYR